MKATLYGILLVLSSLGSSSQTCIIAFRNKNNIIVGADTRLAISRYEIVNGKKIIVEDFDTVCKIIRINKYYYSATGNDYVQVMRTSAESCADGKDIESIARLYMKRELPLLKKFLTLKKMDTQFYKTHFENLQSVNSVIFYGFENHVPKMIKVTLQMTNKINEPIKIDTSTTKFITPPLTTDILLIGHKDAIAADFSSAAFWHKWGLIEGIKTLIRKEAAAAPKSVAEPIDMISLYDGVEQWIQRPVCVVATQH